MTATQGNLAALSRFVFRAPRWYTSLIIAIVVAAITGAAAFKSAYLFEDAVRGVVYIGLPTAAAAFGTTPLDRLLGGRLTFERSSLLALTCEVVLAAALLGSGLLRIVGFGDSVVRESILAALAFVFAIRLIVILAVSRNAWQAILPASVQTVVAGVGLWLYDGTLRVGSGVLPADAEDVAVAPLLTFGYDEMIVLAASSLIFGAATYGFVRVIDRPWRNALGVSVLDFVRGFVGHVAEGSRELEEFFTAIGEEALVPVTVLAFRRADGSQKARFVLPMVHPGPMGEIGGGNLPSRIAESTDGLAFPPHATAGHDFNLVSRSEVERLVEAADRATERIEYGAWATQSARKTVGEATVTGQRFRGGAFMTTTYAPGMADDVAFSVGRTAIAEARAAGLEEVLLADAHNSNDGLEGEDLGHVTPGSRRAADTVAAASVVGEELATADTHSLRLGTAWTETEWEPVDGIGPLGVRAAVIEAGDELTAYVLIDGNNMEPGLRSHLLEELPAAIDRAEIATSDTHIVNTLESVNQVGGAINDDALATVVRGQVEAAMADLEPVSAGLASERTMVTVFGNDRTETLASHANAMVAMGAGLALALGIAALAVTVVLLAAV